MHRVLSALDGLPTLAAGPACRTRRARSTEQQGSAWQHPTSTITVQTAASSCRPLVCQRRTRLHRRCCRKHSPTGRWWLCRRERLCWGAATSIASHSSSRCCQHFGSIMLPAWRGLLCRCHGCCCVWVPVPRPLKRVWSEGAGHFATAVQWYCYREDRVCAHYKHRQPAHAALRGPLLPGFAECQEADRSW